MSRLRLLRGAALVLAGCVVAVQPLTAASFGVTPDREMVLPDIGCRRT